MERLESRKTSLLLASLRGAVQTKMSIDEEEARKVVDCCWRKGLVWFITKKPEGSLVERIFEREKGGTEWALCAAAQTSAVSDLSLADMVKAANELS